MSYKNLSDCHTHSNFSPDGSDSAEKMLQRAQEKNLAYFALTDHCECNSYREDEYHISVPRAYGEMCRLAGLPQGRTKFLKGIELGQPLQNLPAALEVLSVGEYDVVLGSLHNLATYRDFYFWDSLDLDVDFALERYYQEILDMVDWGRFDVLTHLTYPLRYIVGENGIYVDTDKYLAQTEAVLKKLIAKGIALEVNTSGLRQKIGETMPNRQIVSLYRELGGELITLGSDAHSAADLGKGIESGLDLLKSCGFSSYTVFVKRKPIQVTIA